MVFLTGQSLQVHGLLSAVLLNGARADGFGGKPSHVLLPTQHAAIRIQ